MTNSHEENIENSEVFFQKMNIRDLFPCASCGNGLHITIPAKLCRAFNIEPGDELLIRIEEVKYGNLRELPERIDVTKIKKPVKVTLKDE
jgi:hypothetical protein